MIKTFAEGLVRFRWWVIIATLLSVAGSGYGMRYLQFSNDYRDYFSRDNPQLAAFEALQNTYTKNDNVLFVVAPKDGKIFTRETLADIEWLTKQAWQLPYSSRVDSVTNFQHTQASGDDLIVENLVKDAASLSGTALERIKDVALHEPLLLNRVINATANVTSVNVTIILPGKALSEVPEVTAAAQKLMEQVKARNPQLDVYLTGEVPMNNAFSEYAQKDLETLVPIMYGVIILVTLLALRGSVAGTFGTVLLIVFSTVTAMGLTGWLGIKLTAPSVSAPTVILTLAVANSIHLLLVIVQSMRAGHDKRAAVVESLQINMYPVTITCLTDVIGFSVMNFSDVPPIQDLGNIVALGVAATWLYSILFLPAVMAVLPLRIKPAVTHSVFNMDRFADFVIRRRKILLWGASLITLALFACIPKNELNDQYVNYFDRSVDFRRASDFTVAAFGGFNPIDYSLSAGQSGGISNPAYLQKLEQFAEWLRSQPDVNHVDTITDVMKRLNKNMHGDDPAWYRLPDSRELAAQYLLLYELSLPFGLDLNNQINVDKSATRLTATLKGLPSTKEIMAFEQRTEQWLRENAPPTMRAEATGSSIMFAYLGDRNIRSMLKGNIISLLLISLVVIAVLRSLKIGLISLIPNLVPAGLAFGVWGIMVGQVGLSLSVVATMTYGIVVDDTIHFLSKYLHGRRKKGMTAEGAVRYAFSTVGMATWLTSLILVAGFSVLVFSAFELNSSMGLLTAITIAFAALCDLFLLPPLLLKLEGKKHEKSILAKRDSVPVSSNPLG